VLAEHVAVLAWWVVPAGRCSLCDCPLSLAGEVVRSAARGFRLSHAQHVARGCEAGGAARPASWWWVHAYRPIACSGSRARTQRRPEARLGSGACMQRRSRAAAHGCRHTLAVRRRRSRRACSAARVRVRPYMPIPRTSGLLPVLAAQAARPRKRVTYCGLRRALEACLCILDERTRRGRVGRSVTRACGVAEQRGSWRTWRQRTTRAWRCRTS
jgi:hypothetical protein